MVLIELGLFPWQLSVAFWPCHGIMLVGGDSGFKLEGTTNVAVSSHVISFKELHDSYIHEPT